MSSRSESRQAAKERKAAEEQERRSNPLGIFCLDCGTLCILSVDGKRWLCPTCDMSKPIFHEHNDDERIPQGYGIDESHDGSFYPYRFKEWDTVPDYLADVQTGLDLSFGTYQAALEALHRHVQAEPE